MRALLKFWILTLFVAPAMGSTIVYSVHSSLTDSGTTESVVGTIDTDGALGALSSADILGFSLQFTSTNGNVGSLNSATHGGNAFIEYDSNNPAAGTGVFATASTLLFVGTAANAAIFISAPFSNTDFVFGLDHPGSFIERINVGGTAAVISFPNATSLLIGAVPEPETLTLLAVGVVFLVAASHKRKVH